jgi:hypothetical protein
LCGRPAGAEGRCGGCKRWICARCDRQPLLRRGHQPEEHRVAARTEGGGVMAQLGKCRSCEKPVLWVKTVNGRPMPLDPEPRADGNVVSGSDGRARFLRAGVRQCKTCGCTETDACPGGCSWIGEHVCSSCLRREPRRYVSHFATCPHRDQHRKPVTVAARASR